MRYKSRVGFFMESSKNSYSLNQPITNASVLARERKTTGVTGQYGSFQVRPFDVENSTVLPAQHTQSSGMSSSGHSSSTFECRQVPDQPRPCSADKSEEIFHIQERVDILGDKPERPSSPLNPSSHLVSLIDSIDSIDSTPSISPSRYFTFDRYQTKELNKSFKNNANPKDEEIEDIAKKIGVTKYQVRCWNARKRFRVKKSLSKDKMPDSLAGSDQPSTLKRKSRFEVAHFNYETVAVLNESFKQGSWPNSEAITCLVKATGLNRKQIQNWYSFKRYSEEKISEKPIKTKDVIDLRIVDKLRVVFQWHQFISEEGKAHFSKKFGISELKLSNWFYRERQNYARKKIKLGDIGETESSVASSRRSLSPSDSSPDLYSSGYSKTRHRFCAADQIKLEEFYKKNSMISYDEVTSIALNLGCKEAHVYGWFKTKRSKDRRVARSKKGDFGVEDVRSANVTLNKPEKPFTGSQVKSTGTVASAALGAPPLSAGQEENMIAPVSPAGRADAELLLSFSLSGFVPSD